MEDEKEGEMESPTSAAAAAAAAAYMPDSLASDGDGGGSFSETEGEEEEEGEGREEGISSEGGQEEWRGVKREPTTVAAQSATTAADSVESLDPVGTIHVINSHFLLDNSSSEAVQHQNARRMYPTSFKLSVLDAYRSDIDVRGNQRATARKFGIHRRQIQKWLQVEKVLRSGGTMHNNNNNSDVVSEDEEVIDVENDDEEPIALNLCVKSAPGLRYAWSEDQEESKLRLQMLHEADERNRWLLHHGDTPVEVARLPPEDLSVQTPSPSASSVSGSTKRRSFTLQFKLDVLTAFHSDDRCKGNQRATARLYGINRRQVQKWLLQEAQLRGEAVLSSTPEDCSSAKRQRLGKWLWTVPQWTSASWEEVTPPMNLLPPQDTALCLVKQEVRDPTPPPPPEPSPEPEISVVDDQPLPLVLSPKPKRHNYPLDFKLQALDAYHEDLACRGNQRAVAKRFSIHRRQIQKWLKQEEQLRQRVAMGNVGKPSVAKQRRDSRESLRRSPAVLQVLSQQSAFTWMEEMRTPAPCWS